MQINGAAMSSSIPAYSLYACIIRPWQSIKYCSSSTITIDLQAEHVLAAQGSPHSAVRHGVLGWGQPAEELKWQATFMVLLGTSQCLRRPNPCAISHATKNTASDVLRAALGSEAAADSEAGISPTRPPIMKRACDCSMA